MITEAQRQEYIARGYDIIFERNNRAFVVNSSGVASWDDEKKEKFCNATGLEIFFEEDGNPVFYDPKYFEISDSHLHYTGKAESDILQPINCHSMYEMFRECESLQSLDLSNWDVSNVTDMCSMFEECYSLQSLDLGNWNVSNVKDMCAMFYKCKSLQSLDLDNWDVSNVTDMNSMLYECESLQSLDLHNWDVSNVKNMNSMFSKCESLQSLDLSNWDVSNVQNMHGMFAWCESLQSLNLSNWDVSNVKNMAYMFYRCRSLQQTYSMTDTELQEALKSGNWPLLPAKQSNSLQKINF